MRLLKSLVVASAAALLAGQAAAGGFAPVVATPTVTVPVVGPVAARSSLGVILPLALLGGLVAIAVSNDEDDDTTG